MVAHRTKLGGSIRRALAHATPRRLRGKLLVMRAAVAGLPERRGAVRNAHQITRWRRESIGRSVAQTEVVMRVRLQQQWLTMFRMRALPSAGRLSSA